MMLISPAEETTGFLGQMRPLLPSKMTALGCDITMCREIQNSGEKMADAIRSWNSQGVKTG
jgi:hypothetical protein